MKPNFFKKVLNYLLKTGASFSEIFLESKITESLFLKRKVISSINKTKINGTGLRIIKDKKVFYSCLNGQSPKKIFNLAKSMRKNFNDKQIFFPKAFVKTPFKSLFDIKKSSFSFSFKEKEKILKLLDFYARSFDERITDVYAELITSYQHVLICNSLGIFSEDNREKTSLIIKVISRNENGQEEGFERFSGGVSIEQIDEELIKTLAEEASRSAISLLGARKFKGGKMPVIIEGGFGGTILHEACGHALEATSVALNNSVFSQKLGKRIASDLVTVYDDGSIFAGWGSENVDDEGRKTQKNLLIKNGVLKSFLVDYYNGLLMNLPVTGSSRRESYLFSPTSRMHSTYIKNGKTPVSDIIKLTPFGFYVKKILGGSTEPETGNFNFTVSEGYLIENGKLTYPIKNATLIGNATELLKKIDMVGNDLQFGHGICGSISGDIPVDVGQPTIRVKTLIVGGRTF